MERSRVKSDGYALWLSGAVGAPINPVDIVDSDSDAGNVAIYPNSEHNNVTVRGSQIRGPNITATSPSAGWGPGFRLWIANSEVDGSTAAMRAGVDKLVHCHDGAFVPLPNL
jgi:hypothetical protein